MREKKSATFDSIPALNEAIRTLQRNVNGHREFDRAAVGTIRVALPQLIKEVEKLRSELTKGYAVVIHDPDNETIVESQGPVEVFSVDLGGSFDIGNPMEEDAGGAMEQAAEYARDADRLPKGVVKDTLYGAAEQIMEAYGEFTDAVEALSAEDKVTLADWLPEAVGVA